MKGQHRASPTGGPDLAWKGQAREGGAEAEMRADGSAEVSRQTGLRDRKGVLGRDAARAKG